MLEKSFFPYAPNPHVRSSVDSLTFFLALQPPPLVLLPVSVVHRALPFSLVIHVFTIIVGAVGPAIDPSSVFEVIPPLSLVGLAVVSDHCSSSLQSVVDKSALEDAPFLHQDAPSMTLVIQKLAVILTTVGVEGLPVSIWEITFPLALVAISADVGVFAEPICDSITELTFVEASVTPH